MSRRNNSLLDMLLVAPWWISAILAVLAYAALRWVIPAWAANNEFGRTFAGGVVPYAPYMALFFGLVAVASAVFGAKRSRLVDQQCSLETLRAMSWKDFEFMVAEAYRRQGFDVEFSLGKGADGGVDLVLRRAGRITLVQCKQWKVFSVGAPVVRELFGVMTSERADEAIVVTSGRFTSEAQAFAEGKSISLIDGPQLLELVKSVQAGGHRQVQQSAHPDEADNGLTAPSLGERGAVQRSRPSEVHQESSPACPRCGSGMVLRTAKRGAGAGEQFWGCVTYPRCKGTKPAF